jgi:anti-sigma factor RsiW
MTCQDLVELVTECLEGTLSPTDGARFDAHLARCDHCAEYLEQMRQTIRALGRLPEESVPERVRDKVLGSFSSWKQG